MTQVIHLYLDDVHASCVATCFRPLTDALVNLPLKTVTQEASGAANLKLD
jgi:hypothetical protein